MVGAAVVVVVEQLEHAHMYRLNAPTPDRRCMGREDHFSLIGPRSTCAVLRLECEMGKAKDGRGLAVVRRVVPGADARVRRAVVAISGSEGRLRETERAITDFVLLFSP